MKAYVPFLCEQFHFKWLVFQMTGRDLSSTHEIEVPSPGRVGTQFLVTTIGSQAEDVLLELKKVDLKMELKPIINDIKSDEKKLKE